MINKNEYCNDAYATRFNNDAAVNEPASAGFMIEGYGTQDPANLNSGQVGFSGFAAPSESYRHNDGWNVSFADGHVKYLTPGRFWNTIDYSNQAHGWPSGCGDRSGGVWPSMSGNY